MIKLKDLLKENSNRVIKDVKRLADLYGFKEISKEKAEKIPDNTAPRSYQSPEIMKAFHKKSGSFNEYVIVYDNGDIKAISKGGRQGRSSSIDPSDLEYEWHAFFGVGGMGYEVGDVVNLLDGNPQVFSKYKKGDGYIDVPLKLLAKFGLGKRDIENSMDNSGYEDDDFKLDNKTFSIEI